MALIHPHLSTPLSAGYEPPADAGKPLRDLYRGLAELEGDLHLHIHLENDVLFPRTAAMEQRAGAQE